MILPSAKTTGLVRTTVHRQYTGAYKAVGVYLMGTLVPITFNVPQVGSAHQRSVITLGKRYHQESPFEDYGVKKECCKRIISFNVRHFVKCYLPTAIGSDGQLRYPYTFNQCKKCNVNVKDRCGHLLEYSSIRKYRMDKFIFRANKTLQNKTGRGDIFTYKDSIC